jgi:integrase/recombinase XerD
MRTPLPKSTQALADSFLLMKRTNGCTEWTVKTYEKWLPPLAVACPTVADLDPLALTTFFSGLRARNLGMVTVHQAYRHIRAFVKWLMLMKAVREYPLAGVEMRTPKTLPTVPTDEEIRAVVKACPETVTGRRNRALLLLLTDTGVRNTEARNLLIESIDWIAPSVLVRQGKGRKDRVVPLNAITVRALKRWLEVHPDPYPANFLFTYDDGRQMTEFGLGQILRRLSDKAKLPKERWLHPHALRHAACVSWIKAGVPLEICRRLMGHASLHTVLIYANLTSADVMAAHRKAGAIERMNLGD